MENTEKILTGVTFCNTEYIRVYVHPKFACKASAIRSSDKKRNRETSKIKAIAQFLTHGSSGFFHSQAIDYPPLSVSEIYSADFSNQSQRSS